MHWISRSFRPGWERKHAQLEFSSTLHGPDQNLVSYRPERSRLSSRVIPFVRRWLGARRRRSGRRTRRRRGTATTSTATATVNASPPTSILPAAFSLISPAPFRVGEGEPPSSWDPVPTPEGPLWWGLLGILNIITKSKLCSLNLVTVPKMPNLFLTPLKPSCHPQHDIRDAVLKYAIALLNK